MQSIQKKQLISAVGDYELRFTIPGIITDTFHVFRLRENIIEHYKREKGSD